MLVDSFCSRYTITRHILQIRKCTITAVKSDQAFKSILCGNASRGACLGQKI